MTVYTGMNSGKPIKAEESDKYVDFFEPGLFHSETEDTGDLDLDKKYVDLESNTGSTEKILVFAERSRNYKNYGFIILDYSIFIAYSQNGGFFGFEDVDLQNYSSSTLQLRYYHCKICSKSMTDTVIL